MRITILFLVAMIITGCRVEAAPVTVSETPVVPIVPTPTPIAVTETPTPSVVSPAVQPTPTPTETPSPTPTIQAAKKDYVRSEDKPKKRNALEMFMSPIHAHAQQVRRREMARNPEQYSRQVDPELARLGTTLLLEVCGIDHEPPLVEAVLICSNSLFLVRPQGSIDTITFTHDTRFPEVEIAEGVLGKPLGARRSDQLVLSPKSSFGLIREGFQNATGLPIDFIVIIKSDTLIENLVAKSFGNLTGDGPVGFTAHPIYLDAKTRLPGRVFAAGRQEMDGTTALQYIKAVPNAETYPPELENNERKHVLFRAIFAELERQKNNPLYWPPFLFNTAGFLRYQADSQNLAADFDVAELVIGNLGTSAQKATDLLLSGQALEIGAPTFARDRYYVDRSTATYKNQPLRWGDGDADDPFIKADVENGVYDSFYVEVPLNANPYTGDLVSDYWKPVREDVKAFLLAE